MIPIYKPFFKNNCLKYAHEALDSTWVSSNGKYIPMAQEKLQDLLNVKHVLLLNNGTSACHLMAKSVLFKNKRETNIIVPNNVYVAAWNGFLYDKEFRFITLDADLDTWNVSLEQLEKTISLHLAMKDKFCVLIVHNLGNIIDVPALRVKYPATTFVEDNCEGFLGKYNGVYAGTESLCSAISFFGNKNITSGEGGALITNDSDIYEYANCLHGQGQSKDKFIHNEMGYNYRMTNIEAAILYGQLECLDEIMERKNEIFEIYRKFVNNNKKISYQKISNNTEHSNWMFGVRVIGLKNYNIAEEYFRNNGIEIRPMFYPMAAHKYLAKNGGIMSKMKPTNNAILLNKECFMLPSYPELTFSDQEKILSVLKSFLKNI
jgi:perosamine synthetase